MVIDHLLLRRRVIQRLLRRQSSDTGQLAHRLRLNRHRLPLCVERLSDQERVRQQRVIALIQLGKMAKVG